MIFIVLQFVLYERFARRVFQQKISERLDKELLNFTEHDRLLVILTLDFNTGHFIEYLEI